MRILRREFIWLALGSFAAATSFAKGIQGEADADIVRGGKEIEAVVEETFDPHYWDQCLQFDTSEEEAEFRRKVPAIRGRIAALLAQHTDEGNVRAATASKEFQTWVVDHRDSDCMEARARTPSGGAARDVAIRLNQPYTDTGIHLDAGQTVSVTASGRMDWCTGGCPHSANHITTPDGQACTFNRIAPALPCWSLIGKIGEDGAPFAVGSSFSFSVIEAGDLFLGVNDGPRDYGDNTGQWTATIRIGASTAASSDRIKASTGTSTGNPHTIGPTKMTECEGVNNCAIWTFIGKQGEGKWPSGENSKLQVEKVSGNQVIIRRTDIAGPSAGLTATYRGTRRGARVSGEFTSSWPGHWEKKDGDWYAIIQGSSQKLPTVMHACIRCDAGLGGTLVWEKDHYANVAAPTGVTENYTVERFTSESVVLHRTMTGPYPASDTITGRISSDGNHIVNALLNGGPRTFSAAWGTAINTLPGSRAPDPVVVSPAVLLIPWFLSVAFDSDDDD